MTERDCGSARISRRKAIGLLGVGAGIGLVSGFRGDGGVAAAGQATAGAARILALPKGAIVRTILQDLLPDRLGTGAVLMHEHLTAGGNVDVLFDELRAAGQQGLSCIVDAATGRREGAALDRLKTISTRSGVNVVVAGGYFEDLDNLQTAYPPQVAQMTEDQIADELYGDANAQRWGAFGEIGTSTEMRPDERKVLRAVAKAHIRTGLPIFTHTPHDSCPKCAMEQLDILESRGVNLKQLCIGHLSEILHDPRAELHKAIAKRGPFVGFDTVGHFLPHSPDQTDAMRVTMLLAVLEAGYEEHVLLSSDLGRTQDLKSNWGAGYATVLTVFVPKLRYAGVKEATLHKILYDNPRRFLAFVPKKP
jgi:phosphotriesterase-related protein